MNILVLTPSLYNTAPGQRFRIEQWARYLEPEGFRFTFLSFEDEQLHDILYRKGKYGKKSTLVLRAGLRRLRQLANVRDYDLVFIHREVSVVGPAFLERWIAKTHIPIVYDFDDPIWLPYRSPTNSFLSRLRFPNKVASICRLANVVIVGNSALEQYARRYNPHVYIVPSTIDIKHYPLKPESKQQWPVTLGWSGSHSTLPFLKTIHGVISKLAKRYRTRLLVVSHADNYDCDGLHVEVIAKRWRAETEALDLHDMDIGLGPFPPTGWNPWRCHGKILQYMAIGVPSVASPVGIIPTYIYEGENGFLADSEDEWVEKLSILIEDADIRGRLGERGRKLIEEKYSAHVWAPKLCEILLSVCNKIDRR